MRILISLLQFGLGLNSTKTIFLGTESQIYFYRKNFVQAFSPWTEKNLKKKKKQNPESYQLVT